MDNIKHLENIYEIFKTDRGQSVLKFLAESYVDTPAMGDTPEKTYYNLGQKEFVQGLIIDANTKPERVDIKVEGEMYE